MPWLILRLPTQNTLFCHCYGGPGCTLARSSSGPTEETNSNAQSTGDDQKQIGSSSQPCRELSLTLSGAADVQDLYLLVSALFKGGFDVSVSVQATPASARSRSDIVVPYGSSITDLPSTEYRRYLDALGQCSKSITRR